MAVTAIKYNAFNQFTIGLVGLMALFALYVDYSFFIRVDYHLATMFYELVVCNRTHRSMWKVIWRFGHEEDDIVKDGFTGKSSFSSFKGISQHFRNRLAKLNEAIELVFVIANLMTGKHLNKKVSIIK